jgi:hypothetical protein
MPPPKFRLRGGSCATPLLRALGNASVTSLTGDSQAQNLRAGLLRSNLSSISGQAADGRLLATPTNDWNIGIDSADLVQELPRIPHEDREWDADAGSMLNAD